MTDPAPRPNYPVDEHSLFQWGNTKNAVILRDMAKTMDKITHRSYEKRIARALKRVDTMLAAISAEYTERQAKFANRSPKFVDHISGFKEHLVYQEIENQFMDLRQHIPQDSCALFRAVCKEKVNQRKRKLGIPVSLKYDYTTAEVLIWAQEPYVANARKKFESRIIEKQAHINRNNRYNTLANY